MSSKLLVLFVLILTLAGCSKPADKSKDKHTTTSSNPLLGKWIYTENYFSIGGPGEWHTIRPLGQTVEFKQDGTFRSTTSFSDTYNHYEIIDNEKVKFTPASITSGYVMMKYEIDAEGTLLLTPVDPICIEGCSNKFKR